MSEKQKGKGGAYKTYPDTDPDPVEHTCFNIINGPDRGPGWLTGSGVPPENEARWAKTAKVLADKRRARDEALDAARTTAGDKSIAPSAKKK